MVTILISTVQTKLKKYGMGQGQPKLPCGPHSALPEMALKFLKVVKTHTIETKKHVTGPNVVFKSKIFTVWSVTETFWLSRVCCKYVGRLHDAQEFIMNIALFYYQVKMKIWKLLCSHWFYFLNKTTHLFSLLRKKWWVISFCCFLYFFYKVCILKFIFIGSITDVPLFSINPFLSTRPPSQVFTALLSVSIGYACMHITYLVSVSAWCSILSQTQTAF